MTNKTDSYAISDRTILIFFPPGDRFIRIDKHSAFAAMSEENKLSMEIVELIENYSGPFCLMSGGMYLQGHGRI